MPRPRAPTRFWSKRIDMCIDMCINVCIDVCMGMRIAAPPPLFLERKDFQEGGPCASNHVCVHRHAQTNQGGVTHIVESRGIHTDMRIGVRSHDFRRRGSGAVMVLRERGLPACLRYTVVRDAC